MYNRNLASRVASRHLEAGVSEWVKWIVQPFEVLLRRSNEFVNGPVDNAMDNIFRDLAPVVVMTIGEREIDADVEEFVEGAAHGRNDRLDGLFADDDPQWTNDYQNGYTWGFENAQTWKGNGLPSHVRSQVVRDNVKEFRGELTEQLVKEALSKAWHTVDPRETVKHMLAAVKKHGWKVGIGFALFEILEHTVLPAALISLTGRPEMAITGTLPVGEIILPLILRSIGNVPKSINEADTAGHLDWYLENYGSIRLGQVNGTGRGKVSVSRDIDLSGDLRGADFAGADLSGADFRGRDLSEADFTDANLTGATFRGADLAFANFTSADLRTANFTDAGLARTIFSFANLKGADLTGTNLINANLHFADLTRANLKGADLTGADIRAANFTNAKLTGAKLSRTNMKGAEFTGADLTGAIGVFRNL